MFLSIFKVFAQDTHYSQYMMNPLWLSPALTGSFNGEIRANINYRNQWGKATPDFNSYTVSVDGIISKGKTSFLSIGSYLFADRISSNGFSQYYFGTTISSGVKLNDKSILSVGIDIGGINCYIDPNKFLWESQFDGSSFNSSMDYHESFEDINYTSFDLGLGLNYSYHSSESTNFSNDGVKGNVGIGLFHVNRPKIAGSLNDTRFMRFTSYGILNIGIPSTNTAIQPSILVMSQGPSLEIVFGVAGRYILKEESRITGFVKQVALTTGIDYRVDDAIIIRTMLEFSSISVGMNYDINVSNFKKVTSGYGGTEVVVRFIKPLPLNERNNSPMM